MSMKKYSDDELKKEVLGAAMSKELGYNQEAWENPQAPLNKSEYKKVGSIGTTTIENRFGSEDSHDGWNSVKEESGLETKSNDASKYDEQEYIDNIEEESENGIAPKRDEISEPSGHSYQKVKGNLFNGYLDAVWLSGNEPQGGWFKNRKNNTEEINHILRNLVRENYWHQDPEIENKPYETRIETSSNYIIPTLEERKEKTELTSNSVREGFFPNLRQSNGIYSISRFKHDRFMEIVGSHESGDKTGFNAWKDFLQYAEEKLDFNEKQVKTLLNPNADPEDGGSFGRWMSQENMPEGAITFTSGSDNRKDYKENLN